MLQLMAGVPGTGTTTYDVQLQMAAGRHCFSQASSLCLAPEAARLGNPAEETEVSPAWSADTDSAMWVCPQVPQLNSVSIAAGEVYVLWLFSYACPFCYQCQGRFVASWVC